mmetsp:Transcript_74596/g.205643  ORF Transcript_74596/g.205643 Transcript_74596/m.205643 type:complete len:98 (-) Transcript_74596:333-626(-)|eukprot:1817180-Prymnesium_polylepis.1
MKPADIVWLTWRGLARASMLTLSAAPACSTADCDIDLVSFFFKLLGRSRLTLRLDQIPPDGFCESRGAGAVHVSAMLSYLSVISDAAWVAPGLCGET